jgi:hypothetical protein
MAVKGTHARLALFALLLGGLVALLLLLINGPRDATSVERVNTAPPVDSKVGEQPAPAPLEQDSTPEATPTPEPQVQAPPPETEPAYDGPPHVIGRVTDPNGVPLAGAQVTVELGRGGNFDTHTSTTRIDGSYEIVLAGYDHAEDLDVDVARDLRELSRDLQRVSARNATQRRQLERRLANLNGASDVPFTLSVGALMHGYGHGAQQRRVDLPLPRETVVDFVLTPGSIISGFVVDRRDGSRVAGATVVLLDGGFSVLAATESDDRGAWGLDLASPGVYQLFARHESVGTGFVPKLELGSTFVQLVPDTFLVGDGTLDGRVAYVDGRPAPQLVLEARHDSILYLPDNALSESERIQKELDRGLVIGGATTDARGEFHFEGLQPGRFALRFAQVSDPTLQPPLLYNAPSRDIGLVFAGHRLRVVLQQRSTQFAAPRITCDKLVREGDDWRHERIGSWSGVGDWYIAVEVGARYVLRASAAGTQEDWTAATIPESPFETVASLTLSPEGVNASGGHGDSAEVAGRIQITVNDGERRALDGWVATVRSKEAQRVAGSAGPLAPAKVATLQGLAPGIYHLTLGCAPRADAFALFAGAPLEVVVSAGRTTTLAVQAKLGARLKIVTHAPDGARLPSPVQLTASIRRRNSKDSDATPLVFVAPEPASAVVRGKLRLGGSALCEPLFEPGDYSVAIQRGDGPVERRDVKLEAGQVFELDLAGQH